MSISAKIDFAVLTHQLTYSLPALSTRIAIVVIRPLRLTAQRSMYATPSGDNSAGCQNCDTTTTPLWRKSEDGTTLCNACGLFLKLHGRARPIALKSNIIRSRNRIRTPQSGQKRKTPYDAPATPAELARQQQLQQSQQPPQPPSPSPYEPHPRSLMTPSQHDDTHAQFTENVFDPQLSHPSNSIANAVNPFTEATQLLGSSELASRLDAEQDQDPAALNNSLQTRVNELELVNDFLSSSAEKLEEQYKLVASLEERIAELEKELESVKRDASQKPKPEGEIS